MTVFESLNAGLEYDATNSWSGYNFQGKTAIYVSLKKINALRGSKDYATISSYFLELEWLEDFSIIRETKDGEINYESIHQVKARADTQISSYGQALTQLLRKIEKYKSIEHAYLHTANPINYPSGEWDKAVSDVITTGAELQSLINEVSNYICDHKKMEELSEKVTKSRHPSKLISSLQKEHKKIHPGKKMTKDTIGEALVAYKESLQKDLDYCKKGIPQNDLKKIRLYSYDYQTTSREYCQLNEIDELIKNEIIKYWGTIPAFSWKLGDLNFLKDIYLYLLGEMDKHIMNRHEHYGKDCSKCIPLSVFEEVLNNESPIAHCEEYYLYVTKHRMLNYFNSYHERCLNQHKIESTDAPCDVCQINAVIERIEMLTFPELKELVRVSNPDVQAKHDIDSLDQYCAESRYNNPFLKGLKIIKQPYDPERLPISFMSKDKLLHLLTTLKDDDAPRPIQAICQKILKNYDLPEIFMDYDVLLSKDLKSFSILNDAGDFLGDFEMDENNIYHFKNVQIQSLDDSLDKLNI